MYVDSKLEGKVTLLSQLWRVLHTLELLTVRNQNSWDNCYHTVCLFASCIFLPVGHVLFLDFILEEVILFSFC